MFKGMLISAVLSLSMPLLSMENEMVSNLINFGTIIDKKYEEYKGRATYTVNMFTEFNNEHYGIIVTKLPNSVVDYTGSIRTSNYTVGLNEEQSFMMFTYFDNYRNFNDYKELPKS